MNRFLSEMAGKTRGITTVAGPFLIKIIEQNYRLTLYVFSKLVG